MFKGIFKDGFKGFGGNLMKYMMMSQMFNKNNNNNISTGFDMNTLLMMQMINGKSEEENLLSELFNFDEEDTNKTEQVS